MAQVKIGQFKFGEDTFTLRYVLERDQQVKFVAKDIANSLKYANCKDAIIKHVNLKYKFTYAEQGSEIATPAVDTVAKQGDPLYLQPHTILITKEGVIQLIMKSKLPYAVELQTWLLEEVIPQVLCTGKYAPAVKNSDVEMLSTSLREANNKIVEINSKMMEYMDALVKCNVGLIEARRDLQKSHDDFRDYANRVADIFQDVVTKPANPQLCHSLAVCDLGNDQFAFVRPQKRSLQRSLRRLGSSNVIFSSDYVPNSMNVLNKVKEFIPRNNFKAKHNKITLLENYTKEQLMDVINSTMTERQIARLNNLRNM
ncbi:baculovirus repeated namegeneORF [Condylorrhiza vestigialis mutiple nucleopolyhedrovirus]|uniref:Baculovirus repeated namegeneORF n=1 Tax=Condylorrhiza vestigialis mutiple nucleopolyhedrovirus TaxID=1592576 RepID=A0A0B4ULX8_9ABAC|nr:baculovirus repeated namegeneORF [Condylorrhiza vestigialis mutiple nucleopolyhedrovirus]AJD09183.1 baculovirus repeated namegeneORF [Condylorrhiza vestigialis mutiple nucleopolyhedrovirus]